MYRAFKHRATASKQCSPDNAHTGLATKDMSGGFMDLLETLMKAQGGDSLRELASQFGLGERQTASAVENLLPALAGGLRRNISQGGLDNLMGALAKGQHDRYLDDPSVLRSETAREDGNGILGHILGSKTVSREVASRASANTGISESILKKMLPLVAAMAMGAMSKKVSGSRTAATGAAASGGADILSMVSPLLDKDRDGSIADDILGSVSQYFKK
jgi:hypothetical protein